MNVLKGRRSTHERNSNAKYSRENIFFKMVTQGKEKAIKKGEWDTVKLSYYFWEFEFVSQMLLQRELSVFLN